MGAVSLLFVPTSRRSKLRQHGAEAVSSSELKLELDTSEGRWSEDDVMTAQEVRVALCGVKTETLRTSGDGFAESYQQEVHQHFLVIQ